MKSRERNRTPLTYLHSNFISLSVIPENLKHASDLYNLISQYVQCIEMLTYDAIIQSWITYNPNVSPTIDFELYPGMGLQIRVSTDFPYFVITGFVPGEITYNLAPNNNWICLETITKTITAQEFKDMAVPNGAISGIQKINWLYDDNTGVWYTELISLGTNEQMIPGTTYRVITSQQCTVTYSETVGDEDHDGLSYGEELYTYLTNPTNPDSNGNGLWDGWHDDNYNEWWDVGEAKGEKFYLDTSTDNDGDRLPDVYERTIYGTPFDNPDMDQDGVLDGHLHYENDIVFICDKTPSTIFESLPLTRTEISNGDAEQYPLLVWDEDSSISTEQIVHFVNQLKDKPTEIKILEDQATSGSIPAFDIQTGTNVVTQSYVVSTYLQQYWANTPGKQDILVYSDDETLMPYAATFSHRRYGLYFSSPISEIEMAISVRIPDYIYYFGQDSNVMSALSTIAPTAQLTQVTTVQEGEIMLTPSGGPLPNKNTLATNNAVSMIHKSEEVHSSDSTLWNWQITESMQFWKVAPIYSAMRQTMMVSVEHQTKWLDPAGGGILYNTFQQLNSPPSGTNNPNSVANELAVVEEIDDSLNTQLDNYLIPNNIDQAELDYLIIFSHWNVIPYRYGPPNKNSAETMYYADKDGNWIPDMSFGRMAAWDISTLSLLSTAGVYFDSGKMIEANRGLVCSDWAPSCLIGFPSYSIIQQNLNNIYGNGNVYAHGDICDLDHVHNPPRDEVLDEATSAEAIILMGHAFNNGIETTSPGLYGWDILNNKYYNPSLWFFMGCSSGEYEGGMTLVRAAIESGGITAIGSVDVAWSDQITEGTTNKLGQGYDIGSAFAGSCGGSASEWYLIGDPMVNYKGGISGEKADLMVSPSSINVLQGNTLPLTIRVEVRNIGGTGVSNTVAQVWAGNPSSGGIQIGQDQTISISAFSSATIEVEWTPTLATLHEIYVVVDPYNTIVEGLENNNIAHTTTQTLKFLPGNPTQNIFQIRLTPSQPYSADSLKTEAQFNNLYTVTAPQTTMPHFSLDGSKIVFSMDGDLWMLIKNGATWDSSCTLSQLTQTQDNEYNPSFSPDGTEILCNINNAIAIMQQDVSGQWQSEIIYPLIPDTYTYKEARFHPDCPNTKKIICSRCDPNGGYQSNQLCEITYEVISGTWTSVTLFSNSLYSIDSPIYTPTSGEQIIYGYAGNIWSMNSNDPTQKMQLTINQNPIQYFGIDVNAANNKIVYSGVPTSHIYILTKTGTDWDSSCTSTQLTSNGYWGCPSFNPGDSTIVYCRLNGGGLEAVTLDSGIWIMDQSGANKVRVYASYDTELIAGNPPIWPWILGPQLPWYTASVAQELYFTFRGGPEV
ncbi:MAG: PD40 domain-containing protein [Euryarchaeota archaeon]|nr:PD40 domain-containing protein [Euryarchaeota archaeon]